MECHIRTSEILFILFFIANGALAAAPAPKCTTETFDNIKTMALCRASLTLEGCADVAIGATMAGAATLTISRGASPPLRELMNVRRGESILVVRGGQFYYGTYEGKTGSGHIRMRVNGEYVPVPTEGATVIRPGTNDHVLVRGADGKFYYGKVRASAGGTLMISQPGQPGAMEVARIPGGPGASVVNLGSQASLQSTLIRLADGQLLYGRITVTPGGMMEIRTPGLTIPVNPGEMPQILSAQGAEAYRFTLTNGQTIEGRLSSDPKTGNLRLIQANGETVAIKESMVKSVEVAKPGSSSPRIPAAFNRAVTGAQAEGVQGLRQAAAGQGLLGRSLKTAGRLGGYALLAWMGIELLYDGVAEARHAIHDCTGTISDIGKRGCKDPAEALDKKVIELIDNPEKQKAFLDKECGAKCCEHLNKIMANLSKVPAKQELQNVKCDHNTVTLTIKTEIGATVQQVVHYDDKNVTKIEYAKGNAQYRGLALEFCDGRLCRLGRGSGSISPYKTTNLEAIPPEQVTKHMNYDWARPAMASYAYLQTEDYKKAIRECFEKGTSPAAAAPKAEK